MNSFYACLLFFTGLQIGIPTTVPSTWVVYQPQRLTAIIHESAVQVTEVGNTIRYHCFGLSKNNDTIRTEWQKENGQLPRGRSYVDTSGILIIRDVKVTDSGTYVCHVSDGVDVATKEVKLTVEATCVPSLPLPPPTPTIAPANWVGKSGETVYLVCIIPLIGARITWTRTGNTPLPVSATAQDGILTIRNANPSDSGFYVCTATSHRGLQTSAIASVSIRSLVRPLVIRVHLDKRIVSEGTSVQINCVVSGNPPPCITWTKFGKPIGSHIQTDGNILRIFNTRVSDQGTYECHATNSEGSSVGQINVRIEPEITTTEIAVTSPPPPRIIVTISENPLQIVKVGSSVTYHCAGRSESGRTIVIEWQKESGELPAGRSYDNTRGLLIIRDLKVSDSGIYVCQVSDGVNINSQKVSLTVTGIRPVKPRLVIEPRYLNVKEGSPVEFRCRASGNPPPHVTWIRSQGEINPTAVFENGIWSLPYARKSDEAEYKCIAQNSAGITELRTILYVTESFVPPPEPPSPIINPAEWIGESGATVRLVCTAPGAARITWTRSESAPLIVSNSEILTIYNPSPSDSGYYICIATTSRGVETRSTVRVTIQPPTAEPLIVRVEPEKQEVTQGTLVEVKCIVTGDPTTTVTWTKLGAPLGAHIRIVGNTLRIISPQVSDRGIYVCRATNSRGDAQASAVIDVKRREMPVIELYPQKNQIIPIGSSAVLQCRVTAGIPTPSINWARQDGIPFRSNVEHLPGGILRFNSVTVEDGGSYVCTAFNEVGSISAVAIIEISTPPVITITPSDHNPLSVRLGDRVNLTCTATGYPKPSIEWSQYKGGGTVYAVAPKAQLSSAIFEINSVSYDDEGTYTCVATNAYGSVEERIQIRVEDSWITPDTSTLSPITNGSQVGVTIFGEDLRIPDGGQVEMLCQVFGGEHGAIYLDWKRKDGQNLPQQSTVRDGILLIPVVTKDDGGEYVCQGRNSRGIVLFTVISHLEIIFPPRIELEPIQQVVRTGDSPSIFCRVTGDPPINLEWYAVGRPLPYTVSRNGGLLQFNRITTADAGQYVCKATNDVGISEAVAEIMINATFVLPPQPPSPIINPTEWRGRPGDTIRLVCTAPRAARITWTRSENPLLVVSASGTLTIYNSSPSDSGYYICTATTYEGVETSSTATVTIQPPSAGGPTVRVEPERQKVTQGTLVEVNCIVTGDPTIVVTWTKLGEPLGAHIEIVGNTLRIINPQVSDRGIYVCHATNSEGHAQGSAVVDVSRQELPVIELHPQKHQVVPVGGSALLQCRTTAGFPTPSVSWSREDGRPFSSNIEQTSDGIIRFNRVTVEDGGSFVCSASNEAGSSSAVAILEISTPAVITITPSNHSPLLVRLGQRVNITCTATGQPQPWVVWNKQKTGDSVYEINPKAQSSVAVLEINSVSYDDEGSYTCLARNAYGPVEEHIQIRVEDTWIIPETSTHDPLISGSQVGVKISPESLKIPDGGKAEIRCEIYGTDRETIYLDWVRKDGRNLPQESTVRDGILLIPVVTKDDGGEYVCQGFDRSRTVLFTATAHLEIIFPPKIEIDPIQQIVRSGESPSIICRVTGDQPIDIQWYAVGRPLPYAVSGHGGILQFNGIISADAGKYVCKAINNAGSAEAVAEIFVNDGIIEYQNQTNSSIYETTPVPTEPPAPTQFNPCTLNPCVHGSCQLINPFNYTCICNYGYGGRNCDLIFTQCESLNPCNNGGICRDFDEGYKCDCPLGFNGLTCEIVVEMFIDSAFRGDGWLELTRSIMTEEEETHIVMGFEFSTNKSSGVIMWHGQTPADLNYDDYISLAVVDGYVEYQYNLGSGSAVIRITAQRVDDGKRHRVILRRKGSEGSIELDGKYTESGASLGLQQLLNARGSVYLGGVPDYAMTYGKYQEGFFGCIHTIQVEDSGPIIIEEKAIRGRNVYPCTSEIDRPPIRGDGGHVER